MRYYLDTDYVIYYKAFTPNTENICITSYLETDEVMNMLMITQNI